MTSLKPAIVIGSGGHAKVVIDTLKTIGQPILFCTEVDEACYGNKVFDVSVAGHDDIINDQSPKEVVLVNGLGSVGVPNLRKRIFCEWTEKGFEFLTIVHPTAFVSKTATLEPGSQVMARAVVQTSATIGANSIVNSSASVDHDCIIGLHCHIAPGATLSGSVNIGELCHIGTGASLIQSVVVGNRTVVGSGATVTKNVSDDQVVVGTPAKSIK